MRKAETVISIVLGAVLLSAVLVLARQRQLAGSLNPDPASPGADPAPTGVADNQGDVTQGFERIRTYALGAYHADVYRASASQLDFAAAQLVIYDHADHPLLKLEGLESTKTPWTVLYDFRSHHGVETEGQGHHPSYLKDLSGDGKPDVIVGQFSGGERCCTTVTVVELGLESVRTVGRIGGLSGLPFEALELRKLDRRAKSGWQLVAHRRYGTPCGSPDDAADVPAVYTYSSEGQFVVETPRYTPYFEGVLRRNLARWARQDQRSIQLLSTLALDYAGLGREEESHRFVTANVSQFAPEITAAGVEPQTCTAYLETLADQLAGEARQGAAALRGSGRGG